MTTLLVATRNDHKTGEIRAILGQGFCCLTLREFPDAPVVVEDAPTFAGNAVKKAAELAQWLSRPDKPAHRTTPDFVLADDSGLEVDALGGAPGVHSARFAAMDSGVAGNASDADNNAKLLRLLREVPDGKRTGRFRCVIALAQVPPPGGRVLARTFEGVCEGSIGFAPRGNGGFGYDPLFLPHGFQETFAELGEAVKNRMSHRAGALAQLQDHLTNPRRD